MEIELTSLQPSTQTEHNGLVQLRGICLRSPGLQAVVGARITIRDGLREIKSCTTDRTGEFRVYLPPGNYTIVATANGLATSELPAMVYAPLRVDFLMRRRAW